MGLVFWVTIVGDSLMLLSGHPHGLLETRFREVECLDVSSSSHYKKASFLRGLSHYNNCSIYTSCYMSRLISIILLRLRCKTPLDIRLLYKTPKPRFNFKYVSWLESDFFSTHQYTYPSVCTHSLHPMQ